MFELDLNIGIEGQVEGDAGAELDEADAFSVLDGVAGFGPGDDAACDEAGDEADADFFLRVGCRAEPEHDIFVSGGGVEVQGVEEFALMVAQVADGAGDGGFLDVHIEH